MSTSIIITFVETASIIATVLLALPRKQLLAAHLRAAGCGKVILALKFCSRSVEFVAPGGLGRGDLRQRGQAAQTATLSCQKRQLRGARQLL